jgi:hypothetical protein
MPPRKATKGNTTQAIKWYDTAEYLQLKRKVDNLETLIEFLIYEIPGEKGERLRKRFYGE